MEPQEIDEEYRTAWIKAEYETMGWDKEPSPRRNLKLDKTGTKLIPIDKIEKEG